MAVLAESPGRVEEQVGRPLIGQFGYVLNAALKEAGADRSDVALLNVLLCKTPKFMKPAIWRQAQMACKPRLDRELAVIKPRVILTLGSKALYALTGLHNVTPWYGAPLDAKISPLASITNALIFPSTMDAHHKPAMRPVFKRWVKTAKQLSTGELQPFKWRRLVTKPPFEPALKELLTLVNTDVNTMLSVDIENTILTHRIRCIGIGTDELAVSVPLLPNPTEEDLKAGYGHTNERVLYLLKALLKHPCPKVGHNMQHDVKELEEAGFELGGEIQDTLLMHAVAAPQLSHRLTDVAAFELHAERWKTIFGELGDDKNERDSRWDLAPLTDLLSYNAKDVQATAIIAKTLWPQVLHIHNGRELYENYRRLENLAMRMRQHGIQVDISKFDGHRTSLRGILEDTRQKFASLKFPEWVLLGATGQGPSLSRLYFDIFEVTPFSYNKEHGGPSLDGKALQRYASDTTLPPVVQAASRLILKYRKHAKLLTTYIEASAKKENKAKEIQKSKSLKDLLDNNNVAHPIWRPWGTRTNRWAANEPPLQTIPKPKVDEHKVVIYPGLRDLFCAHPGNFMAEADYSQLELRILALLAGAKKLLNWYAEGADVHMLNAKEIFRTPKPSKEQRDLAKRVVYGCVTMDTQALTRKGWQVYDQLKVGDEILTYNAKTNMKEWTPIEHLTYHENAEVWKMSNRSFTVKTTVDHRWFVRQRTWKERFFAKPYMRAVEIKTTEELNTESNIVCNAPMTPDEQGIDLADVLSLRKYGANWTSLVCSMSSEARRAFLVGFLLADGHQGGRCDDIWGWNQNKGEIADAALAASFIEHAGAVWFTDRYDSPSPMWSVKLSKKSHVTGQKLVKQQVENQPVWCPTTANGSWVMRQGTCVTITGNCNYGGSAETVWRSLLVDFPGLPLTNVIRVMDGWFKGHPEIKIWQDRQVELAKERLYVEAPLSGKRLVFHDAHVEPTKVLNHPIQVTAGDIMNMAILKIDKALDWSKESILAQVHDAAVIEGPDEKRLADILKANMEIEVELAGHKARFPVDISTGTNWGHLKKYV